MATIEAQRSARTNSPNNPRNLIPSPAAGNRRYMREKYYSAIRTGFRHMNPGDVGDSFLRRSEELALPIYMPMLGVEKDETGETKKSGSISIILSCWNTMVGSAVVALPWAFQSSGIVLGVMVSFVSFVVSFYTCALILETAKHDDDYIFTLKKYFGKSIECIH